MLGLGRGCEDEVLALVDQGSSNASEKVQFVLSSKPKAG